MQNKEFKVLSRKRKTMFLKIMTEMEGKTLTIYLDNETGKVLYPLTIKPESASGMTVTLESDTSASVALPPAIPEKSVARYAARLREVPMIVEAARRRIAEEERQFAGQ